MIPVHQAGKRGSYINTRAAHRLQCFGGLQAPKRGQSLPLRSELSFQILYTNRASGSIL